MATENVSFECAGRIITIEADENTADRLREDNNFRESVGLMAIRNAQIPEQNTPFQEQKQVEDTPATDNHFVPVKVEEQSIQMTPETDFKWSNNKILLLISERKKEAAKFENSLIRKKKLWAEVADRISKATGTFCTGDMCDIKWRSLLQHYRRIKVRNSQTGSSNITWDYYEVIDEFLGQKIASGPPPERLLSSRLQPQEMLESAVDVASPSRPTTSFTPSTSGSSTPSSRPPTPHSPPPKRNNRHEHLDEMQKYFISKTNVMQQQAIEQSKFREELLQIEKEKLQELKNISNLLAQIINK